MPPPLTLVICATPRTGSTLLCALLAASGVAGRPESWYRAEDRATYAESWSVSRDATGAPDPAGYLAAAIRAARSPNGICGLRIQAVTLPALLADLRRLPGPPAADLATLERAFGPCHFVWCRRRDDVAQAISRLKAEVSQIWHLDERRPAPPAGHAAYDADRIDAYRAEAAAGHAMWAGWFAGQGLVPTILDYEDFAADPAGHVGRLLAGLGLALTSDTVPTVPNRRMADAESAAWAARYRAERSLAAAAG